MAQREHNNQFTTHRSIPAFVGYSDRGHFGIFDRVEEFEAIKGADETNGGTWFGPFEIQGSELAGFVQGRFVDPL